MLTNQLALSNFNSQSFYIVSQRDMEMVDTVSLFIIHCSEYLYTELCCPKTQTSGKHAHVIYTPLKPTFILHNWGMQGYTFFLIFAPKQIFQLKISNFIGKKSLYIAWASFRNDRQRSSMLVSFLHLDSEWL